jgi:hypothetical protein
VGSYAESTKGIIACARKTKYKPLFSEIRVHGMRPVIIDHQPIHSWKNIIRRFVDDKDYRRFTNKCLNDKWIMERMQKIYVDTTTNQLQLDVDIKRRIYLHAELNILTYIMDQNIRNRVFIAVSKRCCYLCELYINFVQKEGYNVIISGKQKKVYSGWKLPHVSDINFKIRSLEYILDHLDQIIIRNIYNNYKLA